MCVFNSFQKKKSLQKSRDKGTESEFLKTIGSEKNTVNFSSSSSSSSSSSVCSVSSVSSFFLFGSRTNQTDRQTARRQSPSIAVNRRLSAVCGLHLCSPPSSRSLKKNFCTEEEERVRERERKTLQFQIF